MFNHQNDILRMADGPPKKELKKIDYVPTIKDQSRFLEKIMFDEASENYVSEGSAWKI